MKFLQTLLLAAALFGNASASEVMRKLANLNTDVRPLDPMPLRLDEDGNLFGLRRPIGNLGSGATVIVPRPVSDKDNATKAKDANTAMHRQLASEINERRRLANATGVEILSPVSEDGKRLSLPSENAIKLLIAGLGDVSVMVKFELAAKNYTLEFSLDDFTLDGVASVLMELPHEGTYTWTLGYTLDGAEQTLAGGEFDYEHPAEAVASKSAVDTIQKNSGSLSDSYTQVGEDAFLGDGKVKLAVGRIVFQAAGTEYACTGTVVKDNKTGRTLIFTAAHCVFDDAHWEFGSNVIFVPDRDSHPLAGTVEGEDIYRNCEQDVCGCWSLSGGVVHERWATTEWPLRLEYDYGFYIVDDVGSHQGTSCGSDALDQVAAPLDFGVGETIVGEWMHNFGYSLDYNPDLRYCAEPTITKLIPGESESTAWMDTCGHTAGASGGPWIKEFDPATGSGKVVSTNSWSYSTRAGMGGPIIEESAARCLINYAREVDFNVLMSDVEGWQGDFAPCHDRPCIDDEETVRKLRGRRKLCEETQIKRAKAMEEKP